MPRQIAHNRLPAIGRLPAINRKAIPNPPNDGKLIAILDTNVVVDGLIARHEGRSADVCYKILEKLESNHFHLAMNSYLLEEYSRVLGGKATVKTKVNTTDVSELINYVTSYGYFGRLLVDKDDISRDRDDNILFDGSQMLSANYLVTSDWNDLNPAKLKNKPGNVIIVKPADFIVLI